MDSADKPKELIARQSVEIERLIAAYNMGTESYRALEKERDAAQAEVERLERIETALKADISSICGARDAALARLSELEKQEPVAHRYRFSHPISGHPVWRNESTTWNGQCVQEVQLLFAAAGASPEPSALQAENAKLITALAACRDAFPVPDAGSRLDDWYCTAMADPLEVPEYVKACVGASPVQPSQAQACKPLCELCVKRGYDFCANVAKTTPLPVVQPSQAGELSDTEALNFMELDRGNRVLSIGTGWYGRSSYGKPLKRFGNLRDAIIAAINAKESK